MKTSRVTRKGTELIVIGLGLLLSFQNCSRVRVSELSSVQADNSGPTPSYMTATLGKDAVFPDLKMVFVVDNSYSMRANNVNLSSSFQAMFHNQQNSSSLDPFNSTVFITNTAQSSVLPGEDRFNLLPTLDLSSFSGRTFDANLGKIPGDVIGYQLKYASASDGTYSANYLPALLAGFSSQGIPSDRIVKPIDGSVADLSSEFQSRLKALDGAAIPSKFDGFSPLDNESGLCGLARMLKASDSYFKMGDQAAFVIVSDENDNTLGNASRCVESTSRSLDPSAQVFDGNCQAPATQVNLKRFKTKINMLSLPGYISVLTVQKTVPATDDICKYDYVTAAHYRLGKMIDVSTNDSCTYDYANGANYRLTKKSLTTNVTYWSTTAGVCRLRDGIKVCEGGLRTQSVAGDLSSNCSQAMALVNDSSADLSKQAPACVVTSADVQVAASTLDLKNFTSLPAIGACSADIVSLLKSQGMNFEACNITSVGRHAAVTVDLGSRSSTLAADCLAKAQSVCGNSAGSSLDCKVMGTVAGVVKSQDSQVEIGSLPVSNFSGLPVVGVCPSNIVTNLAGQGKIFDTCQILDLVHQQKTEDLGVSNTNLTALCTSHATAICSNSSGAIMGCSLVSAAAGTPASTTSVNSSYSSNFSCATLCANSAGVCSGSGTIGDFLAGQSGMVAGSCVVTQNAAIPAGIPSTADYDGTFTCDSPCTGTSLCSGQAGTVGDYVLSSLKKTCASTSAYKVDVSPDVVLGSVSCGDVAASYLSKNLECQSTSSTTKVVKNISNEPVSHASTVCPAGSTLTQTAVRTPVGGIVTKYVVGNKADGTPAMSLTDFIQTRSQELFGANSPMMSVFVIRPGDSMGPSQSVGSQYITMANILGGNVEGINASDYSPALVKLSTLVKSRLSHSLQVVAMTSGQQVRQVWARPAGSSDWGQALDGSLWSAAGPTVIFQSGFDFQLGEEIRVEYW